MARYEFKTHPYDHQIQALKRGWKPEFFAYFMEMGTGKTKVAIDNTCILYERGSINGLVVMAPKGVYRNWVKEIETHMPDQIQDEAKIVLWGGTMTNTFIQDAAKKINHAKFAILIINLEAVNSQRAHVLMDAFLTKRECMLVVDESTRIKNHEAKTTKKIIDLGKKAKYRRILTGSPVTNNPMDMYGQAEFLKPGLLGRTAMGFQNQYCVTRNLQVQGTDKRTGRPRTYNVKTIVGSKNLDRLRDKTEPWSYRARKKDCLDLPEKIYTTKIVDLTPEQKRVYDEFKAVAYHEFDDGAELSAQVVIQQLLRLHQIVCGHVKDDDGNMRVFENNRLSTLMDVLEDFDGKAIIWANYVQNIEEIMTALQRTYGEGVAVPYYGNVDLAGRDYALQAIQNGEARFLVGNPQTAGHGLTLTATTLSVYYSNNYNLELRAQSEDRNHRIGQNQHVTYVDLVTPNTVDEKILWALRNKIDLAAAIQDDGPQTWVI